MADERCPNCGMEIDIASNPTQKDRKTYCCPGCALHTGCTC